MGVVMRGGLVYQVACWMVLVVVLGLSLQLQSTAHASRMLVDSSSKFEKPQVIRADLLHRDHPLSPFAPAEGTTVADRWAAAVNRSVNFIASRGRRLADFQTPNTRFGDVQGEYVMSISFGTPPQKFQGLIDTGSDLVWIQCVKCDTSCFNFLQPDLPYNPELSSSEQNISCSIPSCAYFRNSGLPACTETCDIEYGYGDGSSISGTLLTEAITLPNTAGADPAATGFVMGCMNNNTGIFDNYDGIIGFARGDYSFPSQMSTIAYLPIFSLCLVPFLSATTNTSTMEFGTTDPTNALGLVYTPLLGTNNYYVGMTGISIDGVLLDIPTTSFDYDPATPSSGVIFDSGTPVSHLHQAVYDVFQTALATSISYPIVPSPNFLTYCVDISGVTTPVYPKVSFHFSGEDGSVINFDLADENVFAEVDVGTSCLVITASDDTMIIGSLAMANHYIEIDSTTTMRMGWVSKDCTV